MLETFGPVPNEEEIFIPSEPLTVRNNCQTGQWILDGASLGKDLGFVCLSFKKYFGTMGKTKNTLWGEIFFYPILGDFPPCVCRTYIKSVGLQSFSRLVTMTMARHENPAMGYFHPEFVEKAGVNKNNEPINYFILQWDWRSWRKAADNDELLPKLATAMKGYEFPPPSEGDLVLLPSDGKMQEIAIAEYLTSRGFAPQMGATAIAGQTQKQLVSS